MSLSDKDKGISMFLARTFSFLVVVVVTWLASTDAQEPSKAVVYLREGANYGTGFLVQGTGFYLVTAEHVARRLTSRSSATVQGQSDTAVNFTLADLGTLSEAALDWETHDEADVAALRVQPGSRLWDGLKARFLSLDLFAAQLGTPIRERTVTVMGFPLQLGTETNFSPITSEAKTASGLVRLYSSKIKRESTFYVLDKPSIGGFSGGPAYLLPTPYFKDGKQIFFGGVNNPPLFVGLVHGVVSDKAGNGLAVIVPSKFIVDVIRNADAKRSGSKKP
jgi:hypothetical protein